jgi:hypothetical protein
VRRASFGILRPYLTGRRDGAVPDSATRCRSWLTVARPCWTLTSFLAPSRRGDAIRAPRSPSTRPCNRVKHGRGTINFHLHVDVLRVTLDATISSCHLCRNPWTTVRAQRIKRLRAAHEAFGGTGPRRRWVTDELNHALILRLASEFQGFARDLHDECGLFIARCLAPGNQQLQDSLRIPYTLHRKMNQGNADPGTLGNDFGLFDMVLWADLQARYPTHAGA